MTVNQNEIDALLNTNDQTVEGEDGEACSVDDLVAQALSENEGKTSEKTAKEEEPKSAAEPAKKPISVDTSSLTNSDSLEQTRSAQKILFEVFSSIPDKKERTRLLNWANDAFIKSKFF